jgi:hypothetical protein
MRNAPVGARKIPNASEKSRIKGRESDGLMIYEIAANNPTSRSTPCDNQAFAKRFCALALRITKGVAMTDAELRTADLVSRYSVMTKETMPQLACTTHKNWPVRNDHCFQRIVLDTVCGGVWYDQLPRPAYKHLSREQALQAADLCDDIIAGKADLVALNTQSLIWRGKLRPNRTRI